MIDITVLERLASDANLAGLMLKHEYGGRRSEHVGDFIESEPVFELCIDRFRLSYYPIVNLYSAMAKSSSVGICTNAANRARVQIHCEFTMVAPVDDNRWRHFFEFVHITDLLLLSHQHVAGNAVSYHLPKLMICGGGYKNLDSFNRFLDQYAADVDPHYTSDPNSDRQDFPQCPKIDRDTAEVQLDNVTLDELQLSPCVGRLSISASNYILAFRENAFASVRVLRVAACGSTSPDNALYRALMSCNPDKIEAITVQMYENVMFWHDRCPSEASNALIDFVIRSKTYGSHVFLKITRSASSLLARENDWIIDRVTRALAQIPCNRKGALMLARLPRENFWKALGSLAPEV
jgi:hypothetical protein